MSVARTNHDLPAVLTAMKRAYLANGPADVATRQDRLLRAMGLIKDNYQALCDAMSEDFGHRSQYQSLTADIAISLKILKNAHDRLEQWMQPEVIEDLEDDLQARIDHQPLGVIGVISPWNFPINLAFGPLAGVLAAGNTAMLKPSELTPKTSALLAELIERYFDPMEITVVLGDADVGREFSQLPFDHLVFTGSTAVGKHVMRAAAENLVPVTLELGGKSPVVIDREFDLPTAVQRTLTVKTFNVGQICLSPDYMLIPDDSEAEFEMAAQAFVNETFSSLQTNDDYTAIISERHFERLVHLLEDAKQKGARVVQLGSYDEPAYDSKTRKIAPHLLFNVTEEMAIMQEEIFGPLLPVKTYTQLEDAVAYINEHARPLAAYFFSDNVEHQQQFAQQTTSGALDINDVMTHAAIDEVPFGGVGASGMGAYHGIFGFRQFTHDKTVVIQSEQGNSNLRLRAPYADKQAELEEFLKS